MGEGLVLHKPTLYAQGATPCEQVSECTKLKAKWLNFQDLYKDVGLVGCFT